MFSKLIQIKETSINLRLLTPPWRVSSEADDFNLFNFDRLASSYKNVNFSSNFQPEIVWTNTPRVVYYQNLWIELKNYCFFFTQFFPLLWPVTYAGGAVHRNSGIIEYTWAV